MASDSAIAAGVSVTVIIVVLAIVLLFIWFIRRRNNVHVSSKTNKPAFPTKRSTLLDPSHPACHVTPFGSSGETVRFGMFPLLPRPPCSHFLHLRSA